MSRVSDYCGYIPYRSAPYVSIEGIFVAVFSLPGYRYLGDRGTDRREILHDGTCRSRTGLLLFLGGGAPEDPPNPKLLGLHFGHLTANNGKSQRYMSIRA